MPTFGSIDCPNCIERYLLDDWDCSVKRPLKSRVYVLCSGCKQTLEILVAEITTIHNCPSDYHEHASVIEIKAPDPHLKDYRRDLSLPVAIARKRRWGAGRN